MTFIEYYKLNVWLERKELTRMICVETKGFPALECYGLTQQLRRASIAIISNLAEDRGRGHIKDKLRFFFISRGSLFGVEAQIRIARSLDYLCETSFKRIVHQINNCKKLQNGFITWHKNLLCHPPNT